MITRPALVARAARAPSSGRPPPGCSSASRPSAPRFRDHDPPRGACDHERPPRARIVNGTTTLLTRWKRRDLLRRARDAQRRSCRADPTGTSRAVPPRRWRFSPVVGPGSRSTGRYRGIERSRRSTCRSARTDTVCFSSARRRDDGRVDVASAHPCRRHHRSRRSRALHAVMLQVDAILEIMLSGPGAGGSRRFGLIADMGSVVGTQARLLENDACWRIWTHASRRRSVTDVHPHRGDDRPGVLAPCRAAGRARVSSRAYHINTAGGLHIVTPGRASSRSRRPCEIARYRRLVDRRAPVIPNERPELGWIGCLLRRALRAGCRGRHTPLVPCGRAARRSCTAQRLRRLWARALAQVDGAIRRDSRTAHGNRRRPGARIGSARLCSRRPGSARRGGLRRAVRPAAACSSRRPASLHRSCPAVAAAPAAGSAAASTMRSTRAAAGTTSSCSSTAEPGPDRGQKTAAFEIWRSGGTNVPSRVYGAAATRAPTPAASRRAASCHGWSQARRRTER